MIISGARIKKPYAKDTHMYPLRAWFSITAATCVTETLLVPTMHVKHVPNIIGFMSYLCFPRN